MATEIEIRIEDDGKISVSMEQDVPPEAEEDGQPEQSQPAKSLDDALNIARQMAEGVMNGGNKEQAMADQTEGYEGA